MSIADKVRQWTPGMVITEPGIYAGISLPLYHTQAICDGPSISKTGLKTIFGKSPLHFWHESEFNPEFVRKEKDAFTLGGAAHHLILGEADFQKHYVISKYDDFRTKEAREWKALEQAKGRTVLTDKQVKCIIGMAEQLRPHPFVEAGMLRGLIEHSLFWKDSETGIWLKVRPDNIPMTSADVVDLKTLGGDNPNKDIFDFGYDMQGALIRRAFKEVLDVELSTFNLLFVESDAPHDILFFEVDGIRLDDAEQNCQSALRAFKWCLEHNQWFGRQGRSPDIKPASPSQWQVYDMQNRRQWLADEVKGV